MNNIDWVEISRQTLALFIGLVLGYYAHILTQRRDKEKLRRLISLSCSLSSYYQPNDLNILAVNIGHIPVTIINAGVKYSNGGSSSYSDWDLPKRLDEGEFLILKAPVNGLFQTMLEDNVEIVSVWIREAEGKTFDIEVPQRIKDRIQV